MSPAERRGPALDADPVTAELTAADAEAAAAEAETRAAAARARAERLRRQAATAAPHDAAEAARPDDDADGTAHSPRRHRLPSRRVRLPRGTTIGVGALIVAICASCGAAGSLAWQHHVAARYQQRTAEAAAAARDGVEALMTLDSTNAQQTVQRVLDHSTGKFRDNYQSTSEAMTKDLAESKVATTVTINDVAVQSVTGDQADVLVAVNSVRTAADGTSQPAQPWRVRLTLTRDGGQLKMSEIEFVQ